MIDKVYIMRYTFERNVDKNGKVTYSLPKEGTKGYRDNLIISTQIAALRSKQAQGQFFTPGNFDDIKQLGYTMEYINKMLEDNPNADVEELYKTAMNADISDIKDAISSTKNILLNQTQLQFHRQNMVAATLIGIFAINNVSHAFVSMYDDMTINLNADRAFTINGKSFEGEVRVDALYTNDDQNFISKNFATLTAASVDAVKDPVLNLANINLNTVNFFTSLLRMGVDLDTATLFVSQPIVKSLFTIYDNRKTTDNYISIKELLKGYIGDDMIMNPSLNKEDLIKNLSPNYENKQNTDLAVANILYKLLDINDTFRDIIHMTKYNSISNAVGPFVSDTFLLQEKDKQFFENPMISESFKDNVSNNEILAGFREGGHYLSNTLLGSNFIQGTQNFKSILTELGNAIGFSKGVDNKTANAFSDFYMSFYVNSNPNGAVFDLSYDNRKYMLTEFPKDFLELKPLFSDNALINSIHYVNSQREALPYLTLNTRNMQSETLEDMKMAFIELYNNPKSRNLALHLVEYNFFRGGFGFSPKTFIKITPNVIKSSLNNYIRTLNERESLVDTGVLNKRIIKQFVAHNSEIVKGSKWGLKNYNPKEVVDENGNKLLLINKQPNAPKKKTKWQSLYINKETGEFVKIDKQLYYVGKSDADMLWLQPLKILGNNHQAFEIDPNVDTPVSVYEEAIESKNNKEDFDKSEYSYQEKLSEEAVGVFMDQLFSDEELTGSIKSMASTILSKINKGLKEKDSKVRVSVKGLSNIRSVMAVMKNLKAKGGSNLSNLEMREVLNSTKKTIDDLNLCS